MHKSEQTIDMFHGIHVCFVNKYTVWSWLNIISCQCRTICTQLQGINQSQHWPILTRDIYCGGRWMLLRHKMCSGRCVSILGPIWLHPSKWWLISPTMSLSDPRGETRPVATSQAGTFNWTTQYLIYFPENWPKMAPSQATFLRDK